MSIQAMKLALKALQNTRTHPLTDAEQYEIEMDAMEALDDAIDDQSEWFGLTEEDIAEGQKQGWVDKQAFESVAWWADEKLKEKNT